MMSDINHAKTFSTKPLITESDRFPKRYLLEIKKHLKSEEQIDARLSKRSGSYLRILTRHGWRLLFFREDKGRVTYLYDSDTLSEQWDQNKGEFTKRSYRDPNTYLHLAIALHHKDKFSPPALKALTRFVESNPNARGQNAAETIRVARALFPIEIEGEALLSRTYFTLGMPEELGLSYIITAEQSDIPYALCVKGLGHIFLEKLTEAKELLKSALEKQRKHIEELKQACLERPLDAIMVASFAHSREELLDINATFLWALALERWEHDSKEVIRSLLKDASSQFNEKGRHDYAELMKHLGSILERQKKPPTMKEQLAFLNQLPHKWGPESTTLGEAQAEIGEQEGSHTVQPAEIGPELIQRFIGKLDFLLSKFESYERLDSEPGKQAEQREGKKTYARMWSNETTKPEGDELTKEKFDEFYEARSTYQLFVVDHGEYKADTVGAVFFNLELGHSQLKKDGKLEKRREAQSKEARERRTITPELDALQYRILVHTLKRKGVAGDLFTIIEMCWPDPDLAKALKREWSQVKKANDKSERVTFWRATSGYRGDISKFSQLLDGYFGIELTTRRARVYKLRPRPPKRYCVIEVL